MQVSLANAGRGTYVTAMRALHGLEALLASPNDLERLFRAHHLSRRQFIGGLLALGVTAATVEGLVGGINPTSVTADSPLPQYLVLVVLDGFRPDYATLAPMPALEELARRGVSYDHAWVGQLESETPVGHATLSTGSMPRNDGIIGFEWRDPRTRREVLDGWPPGVLAGKMQADMKASGASSIPAVVKAANPTSRVVSLSSEKVYAAQGLGGWAADYILFHERKPAGSNMLVPAALIGHEPPEELLRHPELRFNLPMKHFTDWDYMSTLLALAAIDIVRPEVLMVNLPGGDVYGHPYGGPATPQVFRQIVAGIDRNLARIVGAYKAAGIFDQTLFVITADHGMVPNSRSVSGTVTKSAVRQAGGSYLFHTGGTAADIYLANPWHARAVAARMAQVPDVAAAYYQVDRKGSYEYLPAPGQSVDPALDAAYHYLLNTFRGPTAPDVVAPFRENTIGTADIHAHGDHGGLNWGAQHVPLILSGPGVHPSGTSQAPARLMDVAPTVLRLMGLPAGRMDGMVLADAVATATAQEVAAQDALNTTLKGHQAALINQAIDNTSEDADRKIVAPPSQLARP